MKPSRCRYLTAALVLAAAALCAATGFAQGTPRAGLSSCDPASVGMDAARLAQIPERMREFVEDRQLSGVVTLVARRGHMVHLDAVGFANIEEIPVQIFDEKGELKAALGEMKTKKETYRNVEQIFVDSRNYYIVAARKKILTFDSQGNFDLVIDFERRFKIIHIDSKDNIYVLQQSIMSPEMKIELAKIEDSLSRLKEEVKWVEEDIQEIRENRDELSDDIDDLIKDKKDKFENLRELQKNPQINKTWIEKLKEDIEDIKEKIEDMQDDRKDLYDDYKDKLSEKKKLSLEEHDTAREKVELRRKANEVSRKDEYEVLIYDTGGEMVFAFLLPKPDSGTPMFSTYNIQSDEDSNFFSIPQDQGHDIATIINVTNERKAILGGAGYQVNVYSSDGSFLGPIKAEPQPPFDGISYIVLDNKRNLFVMDLSFSRIRKFKLVGALKK